MKNIRRTLILISSLALAIFLSACSKDQVEKEPQLALVNFIDLDQADSSSLNFKSDSNDLKLNIKDPDLIDGLEPGHSYIVAYNQDNLILAIQALKEPEEGREKAQVYGLEEAADLSGLSLIDSYEYEIFSKDDLIGLYTEAQLDETGQPMFDDGQNWKLIVHTSKGDYLLYDKFIQLGDLNFDLAQVDENLNIIISSKQSAGIENIRMVFDKEQEVFRLEDALRLEGNVNLIHSSQSSF